MIRPVSRQAAILTALLGTLAVAACTSPTAPTHALTPARHADVVCDTLVQNKPCGIFVNPGN